MNWNSWLIEMLISVGVEPIITKNGLRIDGFYKSGNITLIPDGDDMNGNFTAHARYNETTSINTWDDLVYLNYDWWERSKTRHDGWAQPIRPWADEMVRLGLIKKRTITAQDIYE